jgi:hypothetical protein
LRQGYAHPHMSVLGHTRRGTERRCAVCRLLPAPVRYCAQTSTAQEDAVHNTAPSSPCTQRPRHRTPARRTHRISLISRSACTPSVFVSAMGVIFLMATFWPVSRLSAEITTPYAPARVARTGRGGERRTRGKVEAVEEPVTRNESRVAKQGSFQTKQFQVHGSKGYAHARTWQGRSLPSSFATMRRAARGSDGKPGGG